MKGAVLIVSVAFSFVAITGRAQILSVDTFDDGTWVGGQQPPAFADQQYTGSSMIGGVRWLATANALHSLTVSSGVLTVSGNTAPPRNLSYYPNLNVDASGYIAAVVQISSTFASSDLGVSLSDGTHSASAGFTGITTPGEYRAAFSAAPGFDYSHITSISLVAPFESSTTLGIDSFGLATAVPEPSTSGVVGGISLLAFALFRRSRI